MNAGGLRPSDRYVRPNENSVLRSFSDEVVAKLPDLARMGSEIMDGDSDVAQAAANHLYTSIMAMIAKAQAEALRSVH